MKKAWVVVLVAVFVLGLASTGNCDDALKKLARGAANVLTCPLEIPERISRVNESDGVTAALTYGVFNGVSMTAIRAIVGVYEIATFPIPMPRYYSPILKDPEFFFEDRNW